MRGVCDGRAAGRGALEGVQENLIAAAALVDREVALEHCAARAEGGDAGFDIGAPGSGELSRTRRQLALMQVEAEEAHPEPAQLDMHIEAARQLGDAAAPFGEGLLAAPGIGADADRPAYLITARPRLAASAQP